MSQNLVFSTDVLCKQQFTQYETNLSYICRFLTDINAVHDLSEIILCVLFYVTHCSLLLKTTTLYIVYYGSRERPLLFTFGYRPR